MCLYVYYFVSDAEHEACSLVKYENTDETFKINNLQQKQELV